MNERIKLLAKQATQEILGVPILDHNKFAQLLVEQVLDEVAERAYYCGDRAWSDDLDRQWIQLEFGYGKLADVTAKKGNNV